MDKSINAIEDRHNRYELKALIETCRLLIESKDTEFIISNLLLIVMGKLMVNKAAVIRRDGPGGTYVAAQAKGRTRLDKSGSGREKYSLDVSDAHDNPFYITEELKISPENPIADFKMLFNLRVRNKHLGFLCLGEKMGNKEWKQREVDFVESLATISAAAIDNSEMVNELKSVNRNLDQRLNELDTLFEISKDFSAIIDRKQIISIFKFSMLGQMLIKQFFLVLDYSGGRRLISSSSIKGSLSENQMNQLFKFEDDVVDVTDEHRRKNKFLQTNKISKLLSFRLQKEKMAIIGIGNKANGEAYSKSDINFLLSLGNLALLSIQKTFLLEERIEKERMEEELNIAKTIQQGLFPNPLPQLEGLELGATHIPSRQVGGDYYDIEKTPQGNYLIAIADVTGKGVPAALLMSNLQAMIKALVPLDITLSKATGQLNDNIYKNTPSDKFITFFWGSFDPRTSVFSYVNAGHNRPLLLQEGGDDFKELEEGGLLLGALSTMTAYEIGKHTLKSGDLFVAYTDGVTEAMNADEEEFGEERLKELVKLNRGEPVKEIISAICREVDQFAHGNQSDDFTLIVFRVS